MEKGNKISEKALEEMVREMISKNIKEYDLLYKKKKAWEDAKVELKSNMEELIKNLEDDDYSDGIEKIDSVISSLKTWKSKIQKNI